MKRCPERGHAFRGQSGAFTLDPPSISSGALRRFYS
jgi:hypothetical protein